MIGNFLFPRRIKNLSYNPEKEVLSITFQTGKTQEYCDVPRDVYHKLEISPDEYYGENIYGNYQLKGLDYTNQNIRTRVFKK
jgi:hypothetical protein